MAATGIDTHASATPRERLIATMATEADLLGETLENEVKQLAKLEYATRQVSTFEGAQPDTMAQDAAAISLRNVNDLYRQARRKFGDAAAQWYWKSLSDTEEKQTGQADDYANKLQVAALGTFPDVVETVQKVAAELVAKLRADHNAKIGELSEADRDKMYASSSSPKTHN